MRVVYFTTGISGSGRIVRGISVGNAFKRKNIACDYTIISSSEFSFLIDRFAYNNITIPVESRAELSLKNYEQSVLYNTLIDLQPDILIVDLVWYTLHHFINTLNCRKIFLCRQVIDSFFSIVLQDDHLVFKPDDYHLIYAIEPFKSSIQMKSLNPIILRNRDEILEREDAIKKLSLNRNQKTCFIYYNGEPGDFERVKGTYSYLQEEGYQLVHSTNYDNGIFPIVDYFNAADLLICGGGYNSFWESIFFDKEAIFVPTPKNFESQEQRIKECQEFYFDENGADQLVKIIMNP